MSQSNLAVQPPDEAHPSQQPAPQTTQSAQVAVTAAVPKLGKQKERSPQQQAEIQRIREVDPYVGLARDEELFTQLNHWRDIGSCARVMTADRMGIMKSLMFYTGNNIRRKGGLLLTPAPVAYVEIEQHGSPTDLFRLILAFLVNPLDCGALRQLRSRTWGTLKDRKVKQLIVNNADLLSFAALTELMRIHEKLKISVVLAGSPYLDGLLEPKAHKKQKYIPIHNTFLKYHPYSLFSRNDLKTAIEVWERSLGWDKPLNLHQDQEIANVLFGACQGQLGPLYENLRDVATWRVDHPKAQINHLNVSNALGMCHQPIAKL
ncbi:ATP-binding protein [Leptolyngbya sp. FACHB-671]|uniref:AAA family ATPase n=1 Tax=Leptolyngbya sp. FACHB-671 TaxID=2692812 RepID=UPI00168819CE|nr:AAA family ATPase [Leptolyngbya sp. FACHB-671]MBD2069806.1 ATP-binding protein [Leptolyngbya sp. FACHB-671]